MENLFQLVSNNEDTSMMKAILLGQLNWFFNKDREKFLQNLFEIQDLSHLALPLFYLQKTWPQNSRDFYLE